MSTHFDKIEPVALSWRDGVPYSELFQDIYFSKEHGLNEKNHVFIEGNHLLARWAAWSYDASYVFVIGETGFGTGLNVLRACQLFKQVAPPRARLHIFSAEKHPLRRQDLERCLALWPTLREEADALLASYPIALTPGFHVCSLEGTRIQLTLMLGDAFEMFESLLFCGESILEATLRPWHMDAWFLDGFSPAKNTLMWDERLLTTLGLLSKKDTTCATFSAAKVVREGLMKAGFDVKKTSGFGRKNDMTTGIFNKSLSQSFVKRYTPWHVSSVSKIPEKQAIVLGAGLAGCFMASSLRQRDWQVTLIDKAAYAGAGASGNQRAVLFPNFSAYRSPLTSFMLSAFLFSRQVYQALIEKKFIHGQLNGLLQLASSSRLERNMASLSSWLNDYPALGRWVDASEASMLAGVEVSSPGLLVPHAGWLDAKEICRFLCANPGIDCVFNQTIASIRYQDGYWHVGDYRAPILVITTGYQAALLPQLHDLQIKAFRGQMSAVKSGAKGHQLRMPLCAEGHLLPVSDGLHWLGATYQQNAWHQTCDANDDDDNVKKILSLSLDEVITTDVVDHWAGIRGATPDYLPYVGPVPFSGDFIERFDALKSNAMRFIASEGVYQPGLYVCAGFGSRGLTTIPFSAHYLASLINQEPCSVPRAMMQSLSPARLLRRVIVRDL
jgi:tRNA 5-methylaminomethyl-2-thiouridine biosynthesis bifunctional protein